jgi:hypothetical protein
MREDHILTYGVKAQGQAELIRFERGEEISRHDAIVAKCYECNNWYTDGKEDCLIHSCPLHGYMPYNKNKYKGKPATEEQKQRLAQAREKWQQSNRVKT